MEPMNRRGFFGRFAKIAAGVVAAGAAAREASGLDAVASVTRKRILPPSPLTYEALQETFEKCMREGDQPSWYMLNTKYWVSPPVLRPQIIEAPYYHSEPPIEVWTGNSTCSTDRPASNLTFHGVPIIEDPYTPKGSWEAFKLIPNLAQDEEQARTLAKLLNAHMKRSEEKLYARLAEEIFRPNPVMEYIKKEHLSPVPEPGRFVWRTSTKTVKGT